MTKEELFRDMSAHMVKGVMIHSQLADYYRFLGLDKYAKHHENQFWDEMRSWRNLCKYYICHCNRLIEEKEIENPGVIPAAWYNATRQDVDTSTKRRAVESGLSTWVEWEQETKDLYEMAVNELSNMGECAAAVHVKSLLRRVDDELAEAQGYQLLKKAADYDINYLIEDQHER